MDARVDIRPGPGTEVIVAAGTTNAGSLIEYTGIGSAQARDWKYSYAQVRMRWNQLFVQGFGNFSNAGDSFLFRSGDAIVDESRVYGFQAQHGVDIGSKETLLYGIDYAYTDARTEGTINGSNEDDDTIREVGAYIHSTTRFSPKFDLVLALRWDDHSRLDESHLSPRAALVYKAGEDQSFRVTYNRAFSTPSNNNLFLDIFAARNISGSPFNVKALGVPETGFHFRGLLRHRRRRRRSLHAVALARRAQCGAAGPGRIALGRGPGGGRRRAAQLRRSSPRSSPR